MERKHFAHFTIAGFTYYDGCIAFNKLKIGKKLLLKTEPRNKYDDHAVAIYYKDLKLGFIPREYNKHIFAILETGADVFETRIQRLTPDEHPEEQVQVVVYTKVEKGNEIDLRKDLRDDKIRELEN